MDDDFAAIESIDEIASMGLFITGEKSARNAKALQRLGITHVLRIMSNKDPLPLSDIICKEIIADDLDDQVLPFVECIEFISRALDSGGRVLVHCAAGISRSVAVVVGFLMHRRCISRDEALQIVQANRPIARPNDGFMAQLLNLEK